MRKFLIQLCLWNLILLSCKKEQGYNNNQPGNPGNPGNPPGNPDFLSQENQRLAAVVTQSTTTTYLNGLVVNEQDQPLANATVHCGGKSVNTDSKGFFYFPEGLTVNKDYAQISVTRTGYMKAYRTFTPNRNRTAYHTEKIMMLATGSAKDVPAAGATVDADNIRLIFPANAVTKLDGSAYTGNYIVIARLISPSSGNFPLLIPGLLSGLNKAGEIKALQSFGMANVEIQDDAGNKLKIAADKKVKVEIPAPAGGPASIPIWHFNETYGLWAEEGTATKQGTVYVAEVPHFSVWNLDTEINDLELNLKFQNNNAAPIANLRIDLYLQNGGFIATLFTDNAGEATLINCPSNEALTYRIAYPCDTIVRNLAAVTQPRTETITLTDPDIRHYQLTGTLYQCSNTALPNHPFQMFVTGANTLTVLNGISDAQGRFTISTILPVCLAGSQSVQTTGYRNNQYFVTKLTPIATGINNYDPRLCNDTTTPPTQTYNDSDVVNIPDAGLQLIVRNVINKPTGTIYYRDVKNLQSLEGQMGVQVLTGLQFFTGLTQLKLSGNLISDLTPIQNLTGLRVLNMTENRLTSLTPLQNLTGLTELYLGNNQLTNISTLQNLRLLTVLDLSENNISDISPLQNLTALTRLLFDQNQVTNISALQNLTALVQLSFFDNRVTNLSPLQNLRALVHLMIHNNLVADISPLQNLTALKELYLGGNPLTQITAVQNLTELRHLSFGPSQVSDIRPVQNLKFLTELLISGNQISDLSPLQNFPELKTLALEQNQIINISPLQNLPVLATLYLANNQITSAGNQLQNLPALVYLDLSRNQIVDVSPLRNLLVLGELYLRNNRITTIQSLVAGLPRLTYLDIKNGNTIPAGEITAFQNAHPNCTVD